MTIEKYAKKNPNETFSLKLHQALKKDFEWFDTAL